MMRVKVVTIIFIGLAHIYHVQFQLGQDRIIHCKREPTGNIIYILLQRMLIPFYILLSTSAQQNSVYHYLFFIIVSLTLEVNALKELMQWHVRLLAQQEGNATDVSRTSAMCDVLQWQMDSAPLFQSVEMQMESFCKQIRFLKPGCLGNFV